MNIENSRDYYGTVLGGSQDLRTDACCTAEAPSVAFRAALANVHPEVKARYYGCGLVAPQMIGGTRILDLGSGSGQDAYVLAQMVGAAGEVVGVDATPQQLAVAERHRAWHAERFGFANVSFLAGDIERLDALPLADASFDVVVSNCVINLVADKAAVFRAAHRLLKPGGEMYFSDVYADRRLPPGWRDDPVLHGECLAGALYWGDFVTLAKAAGFADPRLVGDRPLAITDAAIAEKVAGASFFSATWRLFKLDGLEAACEDYGQAVRFRGSAASGEAQGGAQGGTHGGADVFTLDKHHAIEAGRVFPVCGNSWRMLADTRFAPAFDFIGDFSRHYGIFAGCGGGLPFDALGAGGPMAPCC